MTPPRPATGVPLPLFAVICLAGSEIGQLVVVPVGGVALPGILPVVGLLLSTLILSDRRRWLPLVAAACGASIVSQALLHGHPVLSSVVFAVIACGEATAAAWLVQRTIEHPFALNRVPHAWRLVVVSVLMPAVGGILASTSRGLPWGDASLFAVWRSWWLADTLGMLLVAPLVIAAMNERKEILEVLRSAKAFELAAVLASSVAVAVGIYSEALGPLSVPAYLLPFLLWPVFRFGPWGTSATLLIVSLIGLWNSAHGLGPMVVAEPDSSQLLLRPQGGAAMAAGSFLLLASVVAERKRVAQENAFLITELQRALLEVKTLQGFIPICAWCHKVRDDAGFWQRIEKYLGARTDATFSHSICPACAEEAQDEIAMHVTLPPPGAPGFS